MGCVRAPRYTPALLHSSLAEESDTWQEKTTARGKQRQECYLSLEPYTVNTLNPMNILNPCS